MVDSIANSDCCDGCCGVKGDNGCGVCVGNGRGREKRRLGEDSSDGWRLLVRWKDHVLNTYPWQRSNKHLAHLHLFQTISKNNNLLKELMCFLKKFLFLDAFKKHILFAKNTNDIS